MSDDEVIRFEITDYDLDNEFNPNRGRRAKKEQQIYGVWAKDSDEEDNEDNVRQRNRKQKDFSAPIGFIAGGVQQAGKKKEEKKVATDIESAETSGAKPAFAADSSDEEAPTNPDELETAGLRRRGQGMKPVNLGGNVGTWEKHTKGIGAKLLLQMGYQPGKGLGKDLQGISAPVEATMRKGRGAIGAYGPEKAAQKAKREEERRLKEKEDQEKGPAEKTHNWKKSHKGRYFYRDAADVIQEGKPTMHTIASNELSRVPVIDMTGRETRVLSGYHALRAAAPRYEHQPRRACRHLAAPELAHNLDLVVDCCEQDIIQNARELQTSEDEIVVLDRDLKECDSKLTEQEEVISKMQEIIKRVEVLDKPDVSLETAYEVLADLKESYPTEYQVFGLGTIAGNIVSPLISALLATWQPLQAPEEPIETFLKWKSLLTEEAYHNLLWHHYIAHISTAVETWNPRVPEPMLRCFSAWTAAGACPEWAAQAAAARHVAPRLLLAVRAWDPTRDTQPLHHWVLPWHDLAGAALAASTYPLIRARLAAALGAWHPADRSARALLAAWAPAWGPALHPVTARHVLPKLDHCLRHAPLPAPPAPPGEYRPPAPPGTPALHPVTARHVLPKLDHCLRHAPLPAPPAPPGEYRPPAPPGTPALHPVTARHVLPKLDHCLRHAPLPAPPAPPGEYRPPAPPGTPALHPVTARHVLPKLDHCLRHAPLPAPPAPPEAWEWCLDWVGLIETPALAALAARSLLPRWLAALAAWLNTGPPHAAALAAYTDCRKVFPEEMLKEPVVRDAFRKALDMLNRSSDIDGVEAPPPPRFTVTETKETSRIADVLASTTQQKSFSELLESRCIEKGITFVPIAGKTREGRPIYKIGAMQCYVIRNVVMYSEDNGRTFNPISMDRLLSMVEE